MKKYILLSLSFLLIIDSIIVFAVSSLNLGTLLPLFAGLTVLLYTINKKRHFISTSLLNKKWTKKTAAASLCLFFISFAAIEFMIISNAYTSDLKINNTSHIIILGTGLKGIKPSLSLEKRLDAALVILKENISITAIVSGGKGFGEEITEASAMRTYLMNHGIDMARIILEDRSVNTRENFAFSRDILLSLDPGKVKGIVFVTNGFHIFRASILSKKERITATPVSADTPYIVILNCYLREYFAVIKSLLFD